MRKLTLRNAFILSLGLHFVLGLFMLLPEFRPTLPVTETVTVDFISEKDAEAMRRVQPRPKTKHIVEQDKSVNNEKPVKEAYLSAHDQRVEKETAARDRGEFQNRKNAARAGGQAGGSEKTKPVAKTKPMLRDLLGNNPVGQLQERENQRAAQAGNNQQAGADASRTNDYLKDVESGVETMLNTREFKYYTYYTRIRRQLSQYWEPKVKDKMNKMFKQGRRIASDHDHITKLLIVLNNQGTLVKVQVLLESGVTDLDDAAMEAFRAAAPFPNPPKGIIEADGTVKIRWDFILES